MGEVVSRKGYRYLRLPDHPIANSSGWVGEHRMVLYDAIGGGPHPCHWCGLALTWHGPASGRINADHVDGTRLNNVAENLVPACLVCNLARGVVRAKELRAGDPAAPPRPRLHWKAVVRRLARAEAAEMPDA